MLELSDANIKHHYELLDILDAKSTGLLAFNTIFLTSLSVWLGYVPLNYMHLALDVVFLVLLVSCALLLGVIWLRWSRVGESVADLDAVRASRSLKYRIAWVLSAASVGVVIVVSTIHTIGTALTASKNCTGTCAWFYSEAIFGNLDARK